MSEQINYLDDLGLKRYNDKIVSQIKSRIKYKGDFALKTTMTNWDDLAKAPLAPKGAFVGHLYKLVKGDTETVTIGDATYEVNDWVVVTNEVRLNGTGVTVEKLGSNSKAIIEVEDLESITTPKETVFYKIPTTDPDEDVKLYIYDEDKDDFIQVLPITSEFHVVDELPDVDDLKYDQAFWLTKDIPGTETEVKDITESFAINWYTEGTKKFVSGEFTLSENISATPAHAPIIPVAGNVIGATMEVVTAPKTVKFHVEVQDNFAPEMGSIQVTYSADVLKPLYKKGLWRYNYATKTYIELYREYEDKEFITDSIFMPNYYGDENKVVSSEYLFNILQEYSRWIRPFYQPEIIILENKAALDAYDLSTLDNKSVTFFTIKSDEEHEKTAATDTQAATYYSTQYVCYCIDERPQYREVQFVGILDHPNDSWFYVCKDHLPTNEELAKLTHDTVYLLLIDEIDEVTGGVSLKCGLWLWSYEAQELISVTEDTELNPIDLFFTTDPQDAQYTGYNAKVVSSEYLFKTLVEMNKYVKPLFFESNVILDTYQDLLDYDLNTIEEGTLVWFMVKSDENFEKTPATDSAAATYYTTEYVCAGFPNGDRSISCLGPVYHPDEHNLEFVDELPDAATLLHDRAFWLRDDIKDSAGNITTHKGLWRFDYKTKTYIELYREYEDEDIEIESFFKDVDPGDLGYQGDEDKVVNSKYLHTQMKNLTEIIQEEINDIYDIAGNAKYIILQSKQELDDYDLDTLEENSFNIFLVVADKTVSHYEAGDGTIITVEDYEADPSAYASDLGLKAYYKYVSTTSKFDYSLINDTTTIPQINDVEFDSTLYGCAVFDSELYPIQEERKVYYIGKLNFNENTLENFFKKKHYNKILSGETYYVPGTTLTVVADSTQVVATDEIKQSLVIMEYGYAAAIGDKVDAAIAAEDMLSNKCIFIKRTEIKPEVLQYVDDEVILYIDDEDPTIVEYVTYLTYQGVQLMPRVWEENNIDFDDPDDYDQLIAGTPYTE